MSALATLLVVALFLFGFTVKGPNSIFPFLWSEVDR